MLKEKLQADQIQSLKSGHQKRVSMLRYILAQIKNKEIEKHSELNDGEVLTLLRKQSKELQESIEAFQKGGRSDLVAEYQAQKDIVNSYLPAELSDEELVAEIRKVIVTNQDVVDRDPKAIIGICVRALKSKAEAGRIVKILQSLNSL